MFTLTIITVHHDQNTQGMRLRWRGRDYVIERRLPDAHLQIQDIATKEYRSVPEPMLVKALFDSELELLGDQRHATTQRGDVDFTASELSLLDDETRQQTIARYAYVKEIAARGITALTKQLLEPLIEDVRQQTNDPMPPSAITLYRWCRRYELSGADIRSLVPARGLRGNRHRKLSGGAAERAEATAKIIDQVIAEKYLSRQRPSVQAICDAVHARIASTNKLRDAADHLSFPHRVSVHRVIKKLDPYEVSKARFGQRIAEQKYGAVKQGPRPTRPLERVEIDHTKLDLFVVDEETRLPVGRPWMTTAVDKYTRMIVGMYMSFNPPSYFTLMQCLRHAIPPKTYVKERYPQIEHLWDAFGLPETIVVDNGPEFYSTHFEDACLQLGISIHYAPPASGQYKGTVERWFRTQNQQLLHASPGTTFANIIARSDYDPQQNAVISATALDQLAHIFIIDVYHQQEHRGLRDVPAHVWKCAVAEYPPALPPHHTALDVLIGCVARRTISASGIELHALFYNDERLAGLRRRLPPGEKIMLKFDPDDLSLIHVADQEKGAYLSVPAVDQTYTKGLTLWQHEVIKRYARWQLKRDIDMVALVRAKERIQEIVEREWLATGKASKQRLARFRKPKAAPQNTQPKLPLQSASGSAPTHQSPTLLGLLPSGGWKSLSDVGTAFEEPNDDRAPNGRLDCEPPPSTTMTTEETPVCAVSVPTKRQTKRPSPARITESKVHCKPQSEIVAAVDEDDFSLEGWEADYNLPRNEHD